MKLGLKATESASRGWILTVISDEGINWKESSVLEQVINLDTTLHDIK